MSAKKSKARKVFILTNQFREPFYSKYMWIGFKG